MSLILPDGYDPHLSVRETQSAIKYIRDTYGIPIWFRWFSFEENKLYEGI